MSDRLDAAQLARVLDQRRPTPAEPPEATSPRAAVAAIFWPGEHDTELLFIQRAVRAGDPWSGHMAFPGGRHEPGDADSQHTAIRETKEEIGVDLTPAAEHLGSLGELDGGRRSDRLIVVASHCYWLAGNRPTPTPNHEVTDVVWVPVSDLLDPGRHIAYEYAPAGITVPGIQLDHPDQVIWGLTLHLLADLFARLDQQFII